MKSIILVLSGIFIFLTIVSYAIQGTPWLGIMFLLSATSGVYMALLYPDPLITKVVMILALTISIAMFMYGIQNHQKIIGQTLAIFGFLLWTFIGLFGLGTGT